MHNSTGHSQYLLITRGTRLPTLSTGLSVRSIRLSIHLSIRSACQFTRKMKGLAISSCFL